MDALPLAIASKHIAVPAYRTSKRQPPETVRLFLRFGNAPDQKNLFDRLRYRHVPWNQNQTKAFGAGDELCEAPGHCTDIMGYQYPAQR